MSFRRIIIVTSLLLVSACASESARPIMDTTTLIGHWQNRSGGFFRLSWDQCEFFTDRRFSCTSYPLKGDLVLTYDGTWSLTDNQLQLMLENDNAYIYYIIRFGQNSFTIDSRLSGVRTFYRIKDIN